MRWLTWRQHRAEILGGLVLLAAVGACVAEDCDTLLQQFAGRYVGLGDQLTLLTVLPVLAGVFIGAPLLGRELEYGTWRLAWAQGVTRTQWLAVKLALLTAVVAVLTV